MDLAEYRNYMMTEVSVWAAADLNFKHSSFVDVAAGLLEDAGEVSNFEPCYYRGTGSHRRSLAVDGFAFDDADDSVRLFVADPSLETAIPSFGQTEARTWFARLRAFVEEAFDGTIQQEADPSTPEWGLATEMVRRRDGLARIRAYLITDGKLSTRARDWPEGEVSGIPVEYHIWDIERFHRAHVSQAGRDDVEIDFSLLPGGGIPCIEAGTVDGELTSYLCVIPGAVLAALYEEHGSRLLEGNVRSFLTIKRKVNKAIRNTILHRSQMFFAFNNGIGTTAQEAVVHSNRDGGLRLVKLKDLQIVNGGQTTVSLASARRNDKASLDAVFVPMKLSVVPAERATLMIPDISRFANSQNPVSEADFFSNHPFHRRLEEISRRVSVPARSGAQHETRWFYERTRGQYMNATFAASAGERRRFVEMNPREQVLTKTDLAKSENAWRELPHTVSRGAQKNFSAFAEHIADEWKTSETRFHEDYFREAVGRVILFRSLERLVSDQPWYSGGYRANVVAYSMAKLAHMIREEEPTRVLDGKAIWSRGAISDALVGQLVVITRAMHEVITDPPVGVQNVTEWSKRELCWQRASAVSVQLDPACVAELASKEAHVEADRDARSQQKVDSGISAQETVVKLGQEYWAQTRAWAREKQFLSLDDERLFRMAAEYQPRVPNDRESKKLLDLKARLELEGMPPKDLD